MTSRRHDHVADLVDGILRTLGPRIVLALPLGLGKANHIANELVGRAVADSGISLTIVTGLTLEAPRGGSDLERRFIDPLSARLFGDYPSLTYAKGLRDGSLPANVEVREFFFQAGQWLSVSRAQRHHVSANYTHVGGYLLEAGVNLVAQLVSPSSQGRYSLGSNPDLTLDLLEARREGRIRFLMTAQVNDEMPFMDGDAAVPDDEIDHVLDGPGYQFPLFAPPNQPIRPSHYAIGFRIAATVPDGGTVQIGIGSLGDAVAHALILRHEDNPAFRAVLGALGVTGPVHDGVFEQGLYGASEMLADGMLALMRRGVIRRAVEGRLIHAAFFLGSRDFYAALREMSPAERARIGMVSVRYVNELMGGEDAKRRARAGARFINSTMMATLLGSVVSDGLEDGRVVSGIGGQYNFVAQAFALDGARSILALDAARTVKGKRQSNILWSYGHESIPRHLRDLLATEYGIADLRGRTDEQVIAAMLAVADAAFQDALLESAARAGKIARDFRPDPAIRRNTPDRIADALAPFRARGLLPAFPFGTDFTDTEQALLPALAALKTASRRQLAGFWWRGLTAAGRPDETMALERLDLDRPASIRERFYAAVVRGALRAGTGAAPGR
ncbi:acetyl-CoA hydrolase/transferase C-terminal domain-containing protein [Iodidimonas sp. SYSU 1G8]|uniref:acetyl-CoA hydrolase/transferase C-terminal domain-containing protein n=1 Tax=Iodidimonas sp. SYSU 1G8 TaxID=3133967 RepID=UPI0031FE7389